jgi:hypothetical protein
VLTLTLNGQAQEPAPAAVQETRVPGRRAGPEPPPVPEPEVPPPPTPTATPPADVSGRTTPLSNAVGAPYSASQGSFTQADIQNLPLSRTTEFLEQVPGLIVTQHSSILKANQYFLRGFSLDHGTDFAGFVDDVPYNLPSNAHGQGYLDLNSVVPELVESVEFRKGPYYASIGDFSSTGSVNIHLVDALPAGIVKVEAGSYDWVRTLVANSGCVGPGTLLYAVETNYYDGPYTLKEHAGRYVGILKYTLGDHDDGLSLTAIAYNGSSNSPNQIPLRAVYAGLIPSLGVIDYSDFLTTQRYTLNAQLWHQWGDGSVTRANVYGCYYSLNIFNDFTFVLNDPVNGDQNDQIDRRWVSGLNLAHTWTSKLFGAQVVNTLGIQTRNDWLPHLGLHHTIVRQEVGAINDDKVDVLSTSPYFQSQVQWSEKVRTVVGARGDWQYFNVDAQDTPANSGRRESKLFSPKFGLALGPWCNTEFYANAGSSFHSNDARAAVATVDPTTGAPVDRAPPLVRSKGCEIGFRSQAIPHLTTSFALWQLNLQQELVFDGDTGTTSPLRASDRYGIEWSNTYRVCDWLTLDADYSWSHGRLLGIDPTTPGQYIPESITTTFSGGPSLQTPGGWFADLRFRYVGPRPLIEDNSASSRATQLFELNLGYRCLRWTAGLMLLNLFNSNGHDADYFYGSGLPTDPGFPFPPGSNGVNDIHFRRVEPFAARVYATLRF